MSQEELTIVYDLDTLKVDHALTGIKKVLTETRHFIDGFEIAEKPLKFNDLVRTLKESKVKNFHLRGREFEIILGCVRNHKLDFLTIINNGSGKSAWEKWVDFFSLEKVFVHAWAANSEFQHWQNAQDPLQYLSKGRACDHLPKKSNNLPPPLQRVIIDTSRNPGRRILRIGYIEAIGAQMWLGSSFWARTGAEAPAVKKAAWLRIFERPANVLHLVASPESFTSDQGEQKLIQENLRDLLFPNHQSRN